MAQIEFVLRNNGLEVEIASKQIADFLSDLGIIYLCGDPDEDDTYNQKIGACLIGDLYVYHVGVAWDDLTDDQLVRLVSAKGGA